MTRSTSTDAESASITRWRRRKANDRHQQYQRRVEQVREPAHLPWLKAVELDDARDPFERPMAPSESYG